MGFKNRVLYEKNQFYRGGGAQTGIAGIRIYISGKRRHPVQNGGDNRRRCKIRGGGSERYFQSRYIYAALPPMFMSLVLSTKRYFLCLFLSKLSANKDKGLRNIRIANFITVSVFLLTDFSLSIH